MKNSIIIISIIGLAIVSCKKDTAEEPVTPEPTPEVAVKFAADVQPIFQASCGTGGSCHGASSGADGKVYETHAGAAAVPSSTTLGAIKHESGFSNMPKNGSKLSSDKISKIESWINGGKKND